MTVPRIIATIGHGSHDDETVRAIVDAGADILRYNAATMKTLRDTAERVLAGRRALGDEPAETLVDLPFPRRKQRIHTLGGAEHDVPRGATFRFVRRPGDQHDPRHILVDVPTFAGVVRPADVIIIGDGELAFRAADVIDPDGFEAVALTGWYLSDGKSVHLTGAAARPVEPGPYLAEVAAEFGGLRPEYVALSFVESAAELRQTREALAAHGWRPRLVAKIETPPAVAAIDDILEAADLVMFARGDMAIQAPYERLGLYQKHVVARARAHGVPVIIATQVLETTMTRYVPNRSEVLDLTNLILDGAWGVMLAKETSAPDNPVYPVTVARRIIRAVAGAPT